MNRYQQLTALGLRDICVGPHDDCEVCRLKISDPLCACGQPPVSVLHGYSPAGLVHEDVCSECAGDLYRWGEVQHGTHDGHPQPGSARPVLVAPQVAAEHRGGRRVAPAILFALGLCLMFVAGRCSAGVLWEDEDQGFKLEWCDWLDHPMFEWSGLVCGLTLPEGGWLSLQGSGAIEVLIPGHGWVGDSNILVADSCELDPRTARDTAAPGIVNITEDDVCERRGGRVLMIVCLPKMFKKVSPTAARWVPREVQYNVEEDR